jgi:hypothetical protein
MDRATHGSTGTSAFFFPDELKMGTNSLCGEGREIERNGPRSAAKRNARRLHLGIESKTTMISVLTLIPVKPAIL